MFAARGIYAQIFGKKPSKSPKSKNHREHCGTAKVPIGD
jgi:hypothetical protein